ncbi:MAG: Glycosyl transferase, WecB/TagA/CpsF family [Berkelbacteria bacterium GW2011_GWA2_35_9]|uniref:Glycosyl transferase, WecB/TagA/CpsF family n=1 Tax=Berkelbacteria bacterium GW2011_GWA2_35_9 TaxID=1618333 RepID=A0A0G0D785_9BACT|nr:MAG: Glycosyl transferase, WecB/TagA/CpsF family [Berkelbacteria bacterium GW2011_GWA2_35_9]
MSIKYRHKTILGVRVDDVELNQTIDFVNIVLNDDHCHQIATINPEFIVEAQKNEQFRQALNNSDLNINDSIGIKIFGRIKNRIPGADFIYHLFELSFQKKLSFYFLGGIDDTAIKATKIIKDKYSNLEIVGAENGGVVDIDNLISTKDIIARINKVEPDILLVAFGHPKQDIFIDFWKENLKAKIAIGIGGSLDYIVKSQIRAPKLFRELGLEWLWRLTLEPKKRWRRIVNAVWIFPKTYVQAALKNRFK